VETQARASQTHPSPLEGVDYPYSMKNKSLPMKAVRFASSPMERGMGTPASPSLYQEKGFPFPTAVSLFFIFIFYFFFAFSAAPYSSA
jgi:hypothetical protein